MSAPRGLYMVRAAFVVAFVALLIVLAPPPASARMYSPCGSFGPVDKTPGVTSDLSFHFGVGLGPDCKFGTADDAPDYLNRVLVPFTPAAWRVARDGDIPDGATVGHISTAGTLGILNNGCDTHLFLAADLMDATVRTQNTVDAHDPGSRNRSATGNSEIRAVQQGIAERTREVR